MKHWYKTFYGPSTNLICEEYLREEDTYKRWTERIKEMTIEFEKNEELSKRDNISKIERNHYRWRANNFHRRLMIAQEAQTRAFIHKTQLLNYIKELEQVYYNL